MMGSEYGYNMMGGQFGFVCIIIIAITIFVVYKLLKNNNIKDIGSRDNSLNILNERFAHGEIDEEEYNNKKKLLSDHKKQ